MPSDLIVRKLVTLPSLAGISTLLLVALLYQRHLFRRFRRALGPVYTESATPTASLTEPRKPGVIYLHVPHLRPWGNPNASPFSVKLETYLRMAGLPYVIVRDFDLPKAPKKKVPWIELDGMKMGDSEFIIQFLQKKFGDQCKVRDDHFSPEEQAVARAFNRMVSDCTASCIGYARNYDLVNQTFKVYAAKAAPIPWPLSYIIPNLIKKLTQKRLDATGLGRHTRDEVYEIGKGDLKAISEFLGEKPFLLGDRPAPVDAAVFGILTSILWIPLRGFPMKEYADVELPNLQRYLLGIKDTYWADSVEPWYTGGDYIADK